MNEKIERCSLLVTKDVKDVFDTWQDKLVKEHGKRVSQSDALMELLVIVGMEENKPATEVKT